MVVVVLVGVGCRCVFEVVLLCGGGGICSGGAFTQSS